MLSQHRRKFEQHEKEHDSFKSKGFFTHAKFLAIKELTLQDDFHCKVRYCFSGIRPLARFVKLWRCI